MDGKEKNRDVWSEIKSFKRKYYTNQAIKGLILLGSIVFSVFLIINLLEFSFRFGSGVRLVLLFLLIISFGVAFYIYLLDPVLILFGRKTGMSDEEAARRIGQSFPSIKDRLLNLIQLRSRSEDNSLLIAGIDQKSKQVGNLSYKSSIRYKENRKYLKFIISPLTVIAVLLVSYPAFITEPTERIVKFSDDFVPEAPFRFEPDFDPYGFKNEDLTIGLNLSGEAFPESVYLLSNGRKLKMVEIDQGRFEYTFRSLQNERSFWFEAAGFISPTYTVNVYTRPNLKNFNVQLSYPRYTGKVNERLSNIGNLEIPEGTKVLWQFNTVEADGLTALFLSDSSSQTAKESVENLFELDKIFYESDNYLLNLSNEYSDNKDLMQYSVRVIKDDYPELSLTLYQDTVLYSMVALGGNITDDYGLTELALFYSISDDRGRETELKKIRIPIDASSSSQGFYYQWEIDSMALMAGAQLSYYLQVWDNDAINGRKSTKSGRYQFRVPSRSELRDELDNSDEQTENQIKESIDEARELGDKIEEAEERMKGKREFDWEDEKLLKEILEQKEELDKALQELKEQNKNNQLQRDRFVPQDENMKEKARQLQEAMEELMDEETRRLFEELQKMLDEKAGVEQMQKMMEQLNRRQNNFQKELERTMELYKRLQLENEINETVNEMKELSERQLDLSDETLEENSDPKELLQEQEELMKRFEELKEQVKKVNDLNNALKSPESLPDQSDLRKEIENDQKNSAETLQEMTPEESKNSDSAAGDKNQEGENEGEESESGNKENESGSEQESQSGEKSEGQKESEEKNEEGGKSEESGENNKEQESGGSEEENREQENESGSNEGQEMNQQNQDNQSPSNNKQQRQKASDSQKKAGNKLRQMSQEMQQMQANMEMQVMEENMEDLRNIVHDLLKLSFDQEGLMADFREVNESDPSFVPLSQKQLKLREDAQIIQDSLTSLANRVFQLQPIITREVTSMNEHMENAMTSLKERRKYKAVSEQQFSMTSMNNLALMLDEVLGNMMNSLASAKGQKKQNQQQNKESLGEMQQQLNQQVQELKESGKTGRELSEELAKLAAEQARIRRALEEMQKRLEDLDTEGGSSPGSDIPGKMEDSELDLVNKRLTEQLIRRQQDILTRLLEAENALRERELDDERKGETARDYDKIIPRSFDDYLKQKEQEIEMLKTLPPKLFPYYKKEVSDYFKRIGEGQNQ